MKFKLYLVLEVERNIEKMLKKMIVYIYIYIYICVLVRKCEKCLRFGEEGIFIFIFNFFIHIKAK